jgi:hypothetical protein
MLHFAYLSDYFLLAGFLSLAVVFMLLVWLYGRVSGSKRASQNVTAANLTEMAILFQTMRNVVHEQKALAREFNESVDKKVRLIRQVISKVVEEHNKLCEAHHEVAGKLEGIGRELDAVHAEVRRMRDDLGLRVAAPAARTLENLEQPAQSKSERSQELTPLRIVVEPKDAEASSNLSDLWVGFDFVGEEAEPFEVPETPPEAPGDPEVTRQAFRALLSMSPEGGRAEPQREPSMSSETLTADSGGNGRVRAASVRARVYEYHDAGMSASEIAQELGIGKGEVRLMLSLRQKGKR